MRSNLPIKDLSFWFDLWIKFERSGKCFTFLLVVHLIIPQAFIINNLFLFHNVGFKYFGHHLLRISNLWLFNLFKSFSISFDLHFEIMYKSGEFLNSPVVDINIFALIFNSSHIIHERLRVDSSFEDLISKENLFTLFSVWLTLHYGYVVFFCLFDIKSNN